MGEVTYKLHSIWESSELDVRAKPLVVLLSHKLKIGVTVDVQDTLVTGGAEEDGNKAALVAFGVRGGEGGANQQIVVAIAIKVTSGEDLAE